MCKYFAFVIAFCSLIFMTALPVKGQIQFEDVTEDAGLIEPLKGIKGHSAAWGDVTGNGYPDLFVGKFAENLAILARTSLPDRHT